MAKDIAIITVHGIGDTPEDYYKGLERKLRKAVGRDTWDDRVHLKSVYYQGLLQGNQEDMWDAMDDKYNLRTVEIDCCQLFIDRIMRGTCLN